MAGIYIHIPFCKKKCKYCAFYSIENVGYMSRYVDALVSEIDLFGKKYKKKKEVNTIFIGGGTPSLLKKDMIADIVDAINSSFNVSAEPEFTIESNPSSLSTEYAEMLLDIGINRISIGVQSLNDDDLKFLGRIHDGKGALKAIKDVRRAGFNNINADIIFSLPNQTAAGLKNTIKGLIDAGITHLSPYSLMYEKNTPLYEAMQKEEFKIVDEKRDSEFYHLIASQMAESGFRHYEVSNYAIPDYECRHNISYWDGTDYYGFGCAAHSFLHGVRSKNHSELEKYIEDVGSGKLPIAEMEQLTDENKLAEKLMLGLRSSGIDIAEFSESTNYQIIKDFAIRLETEDKAILENTHMKLTDAGMFLSDEIALRIFNYLTMEY